MEVLYHNQFAAGFEAESVRQAGEFVIFTIKYEKVRSVAK